MQTPFDIVNQPEKPGYTFVGWTGSNGTIPELVVNVSDTATAKKGGLTCSKVLDLELIVLSSYNSLFVDQNVTGGANDGTSWVNAYRTIQDALAYAGMNDYIWMAKGSYSPDHDAAFLVHYDSIKIIGGFAGWETHLSERDFAKNQTILREHGESVVINTNADGILWDGFIIEGGNTSSGGGIYNNKSSVVIANSIIRNNAAERGGGIYNNSSNPQHKNTIIWGNKADKARNIYNASSTPGYFYSLIEGSNGSQNWNVLFGTDGTHNLDCNPLFKTDGFDNGGSMVAGNYELYAGSRVVDKGNKSFVHNIETLSDIHLSSLAGIQYTSLPFDLKGNERIANDRVDMGAYEYGASKIIPEITRLVRLPLVEGLITDPEAGGHYVRSHDDFVFTVTAKPGYSLDYLDVKTGIAIRDKEGIRMVRNEDGSVTATIRQVTEPLDITINEVSPVSNNEIDNKKVWAYGNKLYIKIDKDANVKIYTVNGNLCLQQKIKEPETVVTLVSGVYTVVVDNDTYKIIIK